MDIVTIVFLAYIALCFAPLIIGVPLSEWRSRNETD